MLDVECISSEQGLRIQSRVGRFEEEHAAAVDTYVHNVNYAPSFYEEIASVM